MATAPVSPRPLGGDSRKCCGREGGCPECGARRSQGLHVFLPCEIPSWTPHRSSLSGRPSASHSESPEAGENRGCRAPPVCTALPRLLSPLPSPLLLIPSSSVCSGRGRGKNEVVEKAERVDHPRRGGDWRNKNGKGGGWWGKSEPSPRDLSAPQARNWELDTSSGGHI